jgi:hypothetical protein
MTEADNRLIAEWLGLCWHEWKKDRSCSCGRIINISQAELSEHQFHNHNPDFSHRDSFWLILEHGPTREGWDAFLWAGNNKYCYIISDSQGNILVWSIVSNFIGPRLAEELLKFIKEEGK